MTFEPRTVLLTNDDGPPGPYSPNIEPFLQLLEKEFPHWDITTCIPDSQKSWIGKGFNKTQKVTVSYYHRRDGHVSDTRTGEDKDWFIMLDSTPSTCVNIALHHLCKKPVDLVISGPNFGRNTSSAFAVNSGTLGASIEANLNGKRSIAFNFALFRYPHYTKEEIDSACQLSVKLFRHLLTTWPDNVPCFTLNVPAIVPDPEHPIPIHVTNMHESKYGSLFKPDPNHHSGVPQKFVFHAQIDDVLKARDAKEGTDAWAISNGFVSITAIKPTFETIPAESLDLKMETFSVST